MTENAKKVLDQVLIHNSRTSRMFDIIHRNKEFVVIALEDTLGNITMAQITHSEARSILNCLIDMSLTQ